MPPVATLQTLFLMWLVAGAGGGCADRLLLFPSTYPMPADGATRLTFTPDNGLTIEVWTAQSKTVEGGSPDVYVLEFTGNGTRAEQIASYIADRWKPHRAEVWVMNYPGFGGSSGPARLRPIASWALHVFDELKSRARGRPIFVAGNSLGSTVALHVASERDIAGVFLQNPPAVREIILGDFGWWNLWLIAGAAAVGVPGDLDALSSAKRTIEPAIVVTSTRDTLVRPKYQELIVNVYRGPVRRVYLHDKGHNDPVSREEEDQIADAIKWLVMR